MTFATILVIVVLLAIAAVIAAVAPLRTSLGGVLKQRAFIVAVIVLGVAALGFNAATQAMKLQFQKLPVPLSVSRLDDLKEGIPVRVGDWVQVSKDEPLDHTIQEVLGTKEFVFRDYVDSRIVPQQEIEKFTDKSPGERNSLLAAIQVKHPQAVVKLAITYYTGMVDTVPHVPEKCYVADGFEPVAPETYGQTFGTLPNGQPRNVKYRYIHFQDTTGSGRVDRDVAYFFHVNGKYEPNNIEVRKALGNLFQRHGYFAKVELMTTAPSTYGATEAAKADAQAKSLASFNDLLTAILPEVERCLPDWQKVIAAK